MAQTTLEVLVLLPAAFVLIASLIALRLNPSPEWRRASLPGILISLAIIIGAAPGLFLPKVAWFRGAASALSISLSLATIGIAVQRSRARRSSRSEQSRPAV